MTLRLFVALAVPEDRRRHLAAVLAPLRDALPGGVTRWSDPGGWHVTLSFLGAVAEERVSSVEAVVASAAAGSQASETWLTGLGAFPSPGRARVLWMGLADPAGVLAGLAGRLADGLAGLGFPQEDRAWTPHLTLARFREPVAVAGALAAGVAVDATPFPVSSVVLFRSHLGRAGARYEALNRFGLGTPSKDL